MALALPAGAAGGGSKRSYDETPTSTSYESFSPLRFRMSSRVDGDGVAALLDRLEEPREREHPRLLEVDVGAVLHVPLAVRHVRERRRVGDLELLLARRLLEEPGERRGRLARSARRSRPSSPAARARACARPARRRAPGGGRRCRTAPSGRAPRARTGSRGGRSRAPTKPRIATSLRSRAFICRTAGHVTSLPRRSRRRWRSTRTRPSSWARASRPRGT